MQKPAPDIHTLGDLYLFAKARLCEGFAADDLARPALDARILIGFAAGLAPERVLIERDLAVEPKTIVHVQKLLQRRLKREPVARLVGSREFWGLDFILSEETLIPRPETEGMIETALQRLKENDLLQKPCRLLDIGTGSGAIAVSLLTELPNAFAIATDISEGALKTATKNALRHGVHERFLPVCGDVGTMLCGEFDLIISNPPYIPESERDTLMAEVRLYDPPNALFAKKEGLAILEDIAAFSFDHLSKHGFAIVEHGHRQQPHVHKILSYHGFKCIECGFDMAKRPRFCVFSKKSDRFG